MDTVALFRRRIRRYYRLHGRHTLPWRQTTDPYRILVSELMLQQTQVARVIPKYQVFIEAFPAIERLAQAPLREVLALWQGLGYNRRAKYLHQAAQYVMANGGKFPDTEAGLRALPGVGAYTAGAVLAFAYNQRSVIIETNIRTVYLHQFFNDRTNVSEGELLRVIETTLPTRQIREWYAALMDYGVYIKETVGNQNSRSLAYKKQGTFKGSNRQLRGLLLSSVLAETRSIKELRAVLSGFSPERIAAQLDRLVEEGLLTQIGKDQYTAAT
jgi:A/G-specific adenine glycosylase